MDDVLLNGDPAILHWIEFVAGNSNDIILSRDQAVLAKAMLREAEQYALVQGVSLEKQSHIDRLRTALAPHKMVPTEILGIIFQYTSDLFLLSIPSLKYTPLRLSHVCSRWRPILRSEPSFWNDVWFCGNMRKDKVSHIKFWIDNFVLSSHPISLYIETEGELDPQVYHLLILSQHQRIRSLRLIRGRLKQFLAMPMDSFPLLDNLCIDVGRDDLRAFKQSSCFMGMENLRSFEARFFVPVDEGIITRRTVPWDRLTSLTITFHQDDHFLTIPQAVELLKQCTELKKCTISVNNSYTLTPLIVHLPHLLHLVLKPRRYDYNDVFSLTHCLIAPALESLIIWVRMPKKHHPRPMTHVKPDIGSVIRHSGCSLRTLILRSYSEISTDADLELELLSSLHTLEAPCVVFSDETLSKVVDNILLPNIETLTLAIHCIEALEHLVKLTETKSSSSNAVPRHLHLTVGLLQPRGTIMQEMAYIRTCLNRIEACGSKMVLRCMDRDDTFSSQRIDVC